MGELKKILFKLFLLLADIMLFGFNTLKQIVLPNRQRKGNLLSSLFVFFIGVVEQLNYFEHGTFSMATMFKKKYIRQTVFIIGGILFLLTLFEWTGDQRGAYCEQNKYSKQLSSNTVYETITSANVIVSCIKKKYDWKFWSHTLITYHSVALPSSVNRFLRLMCIRI